MWKNSMDALAAMIKKYRGRIAYYTAVALVLTAIAFAAEAYRSGDAGELTLPAREIAPVLRQSGPAHEILRSENMEVLRSYTEGLQWNRELGHWEGHAAVDYRLDGGGVVCLEAGTVQTVGESGIYGGFVELACGNRLYRYASITPDESLRAGERIRAGEAIGMADDSMPGEAYLGAHLHLEVVEDGKAADFESLPDENEGGWIDGEM